MQLTAQRQRSGRAGRIWAVTEDLAYLRTAIVNVFFYGRPGSSEWMLIDTGMYGAVWPILRAADERFRGVPPQGIILTHGHFDHVGAVRGLARSWNVPVYAHPLELPYLTGRSAYPPPDPAVGGGAMAALSWSFPRGPIDLGDCVGALPTDGSVPGMDGWRWLHTPGHTAGHISLFRDSDRTLIAGDAVITVKQESVWAVTTQRPEIHGPPAYFTPDWQAAQRSVQRLAELEPQLLATGHGVPLAGPAVADGLHILARDFERTAVPRQGRYVRRPAVADETGVLSVPPAMANPRTKALVGIGAGVLATLWLATRSRSR